MGPMFSTRLAFADAPNALSKAKAKRLSANLPVLDMTDANPASAGFGWSVAELGSFMRKEGLQRQSQIHVASPQRVPPLRITIQPAASASPPTGFFFRPVRAKATAGSSSCSVIPAMRYSSQNLRIHCLKSSPPWKA